jgi:hypothetical protein
MRRLALALALTVGGLLPAAAQYGGSGYYAPQQGYGRGFYDDGYGRRGYDRRDEYVRPGYGYRPPQLENDIPYGRGYGRGGRFGSVCVTSRGNCATIGRQERGELCGCSIPGFGPKRGNVQ